VHDPKYYTVKIETEFLLQTFIYEMHLALSCNTVLSYAKWGGLEKKHEKQMS
jgi:hypothetical protein